MDAVEGSHAEIGMSLQFWPPPAFGRRPALSRGKLAARPSPHARRARVSANSGNGRQANPLDGNRLLDRAPPPRDRRSGTSVEPNGAQATHWKGRRQYCSPSCSLADVHRAAVLLAE